MRKLLPAAVAQAPKRSFYFPTEKCFTGDFDSFAQDLLSPDTLARRGLLSPGEVARILARGRSSELLENKQLMALVILELWMRRYLDQPATGASGASHGRAVASLRPERVT